MPGGTDTGLALAQVISVLGREFSAVHVAVPDHVHQPLPGPNGSLGCRDGVDEDVACRQLLIGDRIVQALEGGGAERRLREHATPGDIAGVARNGAGQQARSRRRGDPVGTDEQVHPPRLAVGEGHLHLRANVAERGHFVAEVVVLCGESGHQGPVHRVPGREDVAMPAFVTHASVGMEETDPVGRGAEVLQRYARTAHRIAQRLL